MRAEAQLAYEYSERKRKWDKYYAREVKTDPQIWRHKCDLCGGLGYGPRAWDNNSKYCWESCYVYVRTKHELPKTKEKIIAFMAWDRGNGAQDRLGFHCMGGNWGDD